MTTGRAKVESNPDCSPNLGTTSRYNKDLVVTSHLHKDEAARAGSCTARCSTRWDLVRKPSQSKMVDSAWLQIVGGLALWVVGEEVARLPSSKHLALEGQNGQPWLLWCSFRG